MTWLPETAAGRNAFDRVFALRPELYSDFAAFIDLFETTRPVDPILIELCRLRIAQLLGCAAELRRRSPAARVAGLGEERIAALDDWRAAAVFSPVERACLAFAESPWSLLGLALGLLGIGVHMVRRSLWH